MDDLASLIQQAQTGDDPTRRAAFDILAERYRKMAYRQAYNMLQDSNMAEDAVQEAMLTAYLKIGQLREPAAFSGWLRRIVMTQCNHMVRGYNPRIESIDARYDLAAENPSPESLMEETELTDQLHIAIDALPEHERAVTEGFYMQGESQKEIAERLQVPVTTVKKRLQYAREHLRLIMSDINAVVDGTIARVLKPAPKPQRQPVYIYNRRHKQENLEDE